MSAAAEKMDFGMSRWVFLIGSLTANSLARWAAAPERSRKLARNGNDL